MNRDAQRDGVIHPRQPLSEEMCPVPAAELVGSLVRRGAAWTVSLLVVRQAIGFGTTAIIARHVFPSDYGMMAMVATLTALLLLITDMGMSWATVQTARLDRQQVNAMFWTGAALGAFSGVLCAAAGPLLAAFYGQEELSSLCAFLGFNPLFYGLSVQPLALLKRQMRQKAFSGVQTAATLLAGLLAVALAVAGAGYWALAAQVVSAAIFTFGFAIYFSGFRISRPQFLASTAAMLTFGGYVGVCNLVTYCHLYLDSVLLGRFCGATELGYYSRAYYLRTLPALYASIAIGDVMIPALSALRHDPARFAAAYRNALRMIALVGLPAGALLGVTAPEVVRLIYGPKWDAVVPVLEWLSPAAIVLPIYQTMGWLFIASGKARSMLFLSLVVTPIIAAAFSIGVAGGAEGMAIASAVVLTVPVPLLSLYWAHRAANMRLWQSLRPLVPLLIATSIATGVAYGAGMAATDLGWPWPAILATKAVSGSLAYVLGLVAFVRPLPRFSRVGVTLPSFAAPVAPED